MLSLSPSQNSDSDYYFLSDPEITLSTLIVGAEQIVQRLLSLSNTIGPKYQATSFYTKARAKSRTSVRGKVFRKRANPSKLIHGRNYSFRDLTDAAGFRIVTLYDNDLPAAVDYIIAIVQSGQYLPEPLFRPGFVFDNLQEATFIRRDEKRDDAYLLALNHFEKKLMSTALPTTTLPVNT